MTRYGTLGDYRFSNTQEAALDIRGAQVYGPGDEKLGEIDDVIFDEATGAIVYLVVDTGGWLKTKRFLMSPSRVRPSMQHEDDFLVDLTKQQIETFPAYDSHELTSEEKWADYEPRYRSKWVDGPVMHREGTDRNITPTTKQQVGAGSGTIPTSDTDTAELDTAVTPVRQEMTTEVSATGPSVRWTAFEDTLRQRREDVLQSSIENAKKADRAASEREELRRKAS